MQALSTLFTAATLPSFNQFFFLHSLFKKKKRKKEKEKRRANAKTISVQMGEYSLLSPLSSLNRTALCLQNHTRCIECCWTENMLVSSLVLLSPVNHKELYLG